MNGLGLAVGVSLAAFLLAIAGLFATWWVSRRQNEITPDTRKLAARMRGKPVPDALGEVIAHLENLSRRLAVVERQGAELTGNYARTVHKVGLARFDRDAEVSGNLSFALTLLDGSDDGVILTSLYGLEGCRLFLRPMRAGQTAHGLLPEERLALDRALGQEARG